MSDSPALSAWPQLAGGDLALGDCDCCLSTGGGGLILAGSVQLRFSGFEEGRQGSGVGMTASGRSLVGTPSPTSTPARQLDAWRTSLTGSPTVLDISSKLCKGL